MIIEYNGKGFLIKSLILQDLPILNGLAVMEDHMRDVELPNIKGIVLVANGSETMF